MCVNQYREVLASKKCDFPKDENDSSPISISHWQVACHLLETVALSATKLQQQKEILEKLPTASTQEIQGDTTSNIH